MMDAGEVMDAREMMDAGEMTGAVEVEMLHYRASVWHPGC